MPFTMLIMCFNHVFGAYITKTERCSLCFSGNFYHGFFFWIYLRDDDIAVFPCQVWRDVHSSFTCANSYKNKLCDVLPSNFLHWMKLKLIKFSKTNFPNYVYNFWMCAVGGCRATYNTHTVFTRVQELIRCNARACRMWRQFVCRMAPSGMHTENGWNRNKPYRYASHNAVCCRFDEVHANNSQEWKRKKGYFERIESNKSSEIFTAWMSGNLALWRIH